MTNKKKSLVLAIIATILVIVCCIVLINRFGENNTMRNLEKVDVNYTPQLGEVASYFIGKSTFKEFLKNPSLDILTHKSNVIEVYSKTLYREGFISVKILTSDPVKEEKARSGVFRVGNWPVYTEFIDFMNNPDNFKQILSEQGIEEKIISYVIIEHDSNKSTWLKQIRPGDGIPQMCIWIHTDIGNYFLEHNVYLYENPHDTRFGYIFYNLSEYSRKYGIK